MSSTSCATGWLCYCCSYANLPCNTFCEGCWFGEREFAEEQAPARTFSPYFSATTRATRSRAESDCSSESDCDSGYESKSDGGSETTSEKNEEVSALVGSEALPDRDVAGIYVGIGASKVVAKSAFARPPRAGCKVARTMARKLWMVAEKVERERVGMAEA